MIKRNHLFIICATLLFAFCGETQNKIAQEFMPTAKGEIGSIMLVMDQKQWDQDLGIQLRDVLSEPVSGLPQDEPLFYLNRVSPKKLNTTLKTSANMIFVVTLDSETSDSNVLKGFLTPESRSMIKLDTSLFMSIRKDEFAKGQIILYLFGNTEKELVQKIKINKEKIKSLFEKRDRDRMVRKLFSSHEKGLEKLVKEEHSFQINIPAGWQQAVSEPGFYWIRYLNGNKEQNVFVYYEPYTNIEIFDQVPEFRDRITKKFLRDGEKNKLFITRQMRDDLNTVFLKKTKFKGRYAIESRGLWKINDNSLGGPYISYTFVSEKEQLIYYIEGFVAAPGKKKRILLQEVDAVLSTFKETS
tara:strand:- start:2115 stop:3185 length:1071 start_codon:yes stop_codon:yes gene_type:complete